MWANAQRDGRPAEYRSTGLKRAARGSLEIQDAKNRQKVTICAPSYNFVRLYLHN